ncbi:hypothetical protein KR018_005069, partial [Drosophila ironensis]
QERRGVASRGARNQHQLTRLRGDPGRQPVAGQVRHPPGGAPGERQRAQLGGVGAVRERAAVRQVDGRLQAGSQGKIP